jgi:uncharacterized membrane protein YoaK (UPF0700 family)
MRLGLAEPLVANRFALWAIWAGALAAIPLFALGPRVAGVFVQPDPSQPFPPIWRTVLAAIASSVAIAFAACWLAFFPPASYRRCMEGVATDARTAS